MDIFHRRQRIKDGDTVTLHLGNAYRELKLQEGRKLDTKFGCFQHSDFIGQEYGKKFQGKKGFIVVLHPTPCLHTLSLTHMTQILYSTNVAMILFNLAIVKNKVVVEAGSGSGSLSYAIANAVLPSGRLHTFEFHKQRHESMREAVAESGLDRVIECHHRDVCTLGFGMDSVADAVILDLPRPWEAVPHAHSCLKEGGGICVFSPCVEQVKKACEQLESVGFAACEVVECLDKPMLLKTFSLPVASTETPMWQSGHKRKAVEQDGVDGDADAQPMAQHAKPYTTALPVREIAGHTGYLIFSAKKP